MPCRSSSCSITARTSSRPALRTSAACAGTCTTSGPSWRSPPAPWTESSGSIASPASSPAPSRAPGFGSPASWSPRSAAAPAGPKSSNARSALLVKAQAPQLLELQGCGALTAAKLIAETAGAKRFASDAKFARLAGVAPIPASSGKRIRHRLDRGGNRQLNCALHRIAVTQGRVHPPAREFLAKKQAEGKTRIEALRCLKRHLARTILEDHDDQRQRASKLTGVDIRATHASWEGSARGCRVARRGAARPRRRPGRWVETGKTTTPIYYYQGSPPTRRATSTSTACVGVYRTDSELNETARKDDAIPPAVHASENYNHIGDLTWDAREGGRLLLPVECYYPPAGNTCNTGSFGVDSSRSSTEMGRRTQ